MYCFCAGGLSSKLLKLGVQKLSWTSLRVFLRGGAFKRQICPILRRFSQINVLYLTGEKLLARPCFKTPLNWTLVGQTLHPPLSRSTV